jgi:hypothetical protein
VSRLFTNATGIGRHRPGVDIDALLSHWLSFTALIAIVSVYYLFLLSNGTFQLFAPELFSRAFGNMLGHLLHGEFTVDRDVIGYEAFLRDGKAYSYFGIFCALLRLAALPFTDVATVDMGRLSCLVAVVIFVALQLRTLLIVHHSLPARSRASELLAIMVAATVLSGPQLYILASAWIYHEPVLWAAAMAAGFNLVIVRAVFGESGLRGRDLMWLATLAGLALLTRPSIGVALYLGATLLILWSALQWRRPGDAERPVSTNASGFPATVAEMMRDRRLGLPTAILGLLGAVAAFVNFAKWGSPFTFADFHYHVDLLRHPDGFRAFVDYGEFNLGRLWSGALYYATGITWILKHVSPFTKYLRARYQNIEAPPVLPLLTNPLTVILAAVGLYRLWWKPDLPARGTAILRLTLIGHASAVLLIFSAMYLSLRYRFDLAPLMTLAAIIGYRSIAVAASEAPETWRKRLYGAAVALCVLGIVFSHYVLILYKVWCLGVPMEVRRALLPLSPLAPY